jgi:hypothetical protein
MKSKKDKKEHLIRGYDQYGKKPIPKEWLIEEKMLSKGFKKFLKKRESTFSINDRVGISTKYFMLE